MYYLLWGYTRGIRWLCSIRNWLVKDNLEDYIDEFLSILRYITSTDYNTEGGIDNDNITELLDNEEFMKEFRQYLCD